MGTRGLFAYRYRGRYYIKYNHCDSYPSGLGAQLVSYIPTDPKAFQRWLKRTQSIITSFQEQNQDDADELEQATEPSSEDGPEDCHDRLSRGILTQLTMVTSISARSYHTVDHRLPGQHLSTGQML